MFGEWKVYAALVFVLGLAGAVSWWGAHEYHAGAASVQAKWDVQIATQKAAVAEHAAAAAQVTTQIVTKYVPEIQVVHERAATIVKQVPVYVTQADDHRYQLPLGFVRLHDAAALGLPLPASAGSADGLPAPIALSTAAGVIASNYGDCRATAEELMGLQEWVKGQEAAAKQ